MSQLIDTLIRTANRAFLARPCHGPQHIKGKHRTLRVERDFISLEALVHAPVFRFFVHHDAAVFRPVRNNTPHIVAIDGTRFSGAIPIGPSFFVELVGNLLQAVIAGRIQKQDSLGSLIVMSPDCSIFRRLVSCSFRKTAICEQPCAFLAGLKVAILAAYRAKRGPANTDPSSLPVRDAIFGALRDVLGVILVNDRRELDEQAPHSRRSVDLSTRSRQYQRQVLLFQIVHQVPYSPAFAMQPRKIVGHQGHNVRICQTGFQAQPLRTVHLFARRLMAAHVFVPLPYPALPFQESFDVGPLPLWTVLVLIVARVRQANVT